MKAKIKVILILLIILFLSFKEEVYLAYPYQSNEIKVNWVSNIEGDFSFKDKWSYKDGVYKNRFGQLSCDGICPERTYKMKDKDGRILEDSLKVFYQLLDTAHINHSIKSEAMAYEYSGTNFVNVTRENNLNSYPRVKCSTLNTISTHSSLVFEIKKETCFARIVFNSITDLGDHTFYCKKGSISIDKKLWKTGILKATFDFTFDNTLDTKKTLAWKGFIYQKIEEKLRP